MSDATDAYIYIYIYIYINNVSLTLYTKLYACSREDFLKCPCIELAGVGICDNYHSKGVIQIIKFMENAFT